MRAYVLTLLLSFTAGASALGESAAFGQGAPDLKEAIARCEDTSNTYSPEAAIAACDQAIASGSVPINRIWIEHYDRGNRYRALNDNQHAVADYDEAIRLAPYFVSAFYNRGNAYRDLGDYKHAISDYTQAIALNPAYAEAFTNRSAAYELSGDHARAIADATEAIRLKSDIPEAYYNRAVANENVGKNAEAIADFNEAIALKPDYANAYYSRAGANGKIGNYRQAIADFSKFLTMNPDDAKAIYGRGLMEHNIGDDQHAAADFREAARLRPDWASFLHPGWMDRVTAASTTYVSSTLNTTSPSSSAAAVQPRDAPPSVSTSTAAIPGSSAPQIEAESGSLIGTFGFDEAGMDRSVAPGDDFYEFANGGWLRRIDIPENKAVYGMFTLLDDLSSRRSRQILEDAEKDPQSKVGNAYAAFLDMRTIEAKGLGPIQPWLNHIRAVQSKSEYASVAAEAARNGVGGPIGAFVSQDDKDSSEYALEIVQAGLGLPDRDYYLLDSAKVIAVRTAYLTHLEHVLTLAGETGVASRARAVLDYETQIARVHWSRADTHDNDKTYNKISVAELVAQSPGFDFRAYLRGIGAQVQSVIVGEPSAVTGIAAGVANAPLEVLKDQLIVRSLDRYASVLPKAIDDENFKFYGTVLSATPQQDERWKRAVNATTRMLSDDLAKIYVRDFFPPSAKTAADQLVENLAGAMARRIDAVTWMLPATKASAHAKLRAVRFKIGYPTHWRDFSGLEIRRDDAFGNALRSSRFEHEFNISKLGKPTYRWEWGITPMTINGYANFGDLSVVFPVAILQPPFFDPAADPAVNYGGIGVVIAHELSHHFDDQGAKYDVKGDLNNWWTPNDAAAFNSEAEKLQRQFDAYEPVPGIHISGKMTSGENVADLAGLEIALDAYHASLGGRTAPVIDGFTGDQRFYLAWAQIWRQKYRDSTLRQRLLTDPHAPSEQRVDVVRNLAPWYDAFDVKPGQKLYLAPEERVTVW